MGFTKTGQPIMGHKFTIVQGDISIPITVVAKLFGQYGSAHLVGIVIEDRSGARETVDWPITSTDPKLPVIFKPGWPPDDA
jgi:hypothetical protein